MAYMSKCKAIEFLHALLKKTFPIVFTFIAFNNQVCAAKFESGVTRGNVPYVKMIGEIVSGDAVQFQYILEQWKAKKAPIQIIYLNSNGGGLVEAYLILKSVLDYNLSTIVLANDSCISACVSILAAGKERYADPQSVVGVHRVSERNEDTLEAQSASIEMMKVYKNLNIPDDIRLHMIETAPSEIYYLTLQDKVKFNLVVQNTQAAIATVQQSTLETQTKTVSRKDHKRARSLNAQGIALINQRRYLQAIDVLEQSTLLRPTDAEVLGNLGYAYYMAGDLDSAQNALTSSLHIMSKRGATWNNLGLVLSARGDVSWAAESFVRYWNYSSNKKAATNQFFYWESIQPGTALEQASRMARARLGIIVPID